jgi:hypothetical protein
MHSETSSSSLRHRCVPDAPAQVGDVLLLAPALLSGDPLSDDGID